MITDEKKRFDWITKTVIGCACRVHNELGSGFLEKCYENALAHACRKAGLRVATQVSQKAWFNGVIVGKYFADLIVEEALLVKRKTGRSLDPAHTDQCINYLSATRLPVALLINFGQRVEVRRIAGPSPRSSSVSICAPSVANPTNPQ